MSDLLKVKTGLRAGQKTETRYGYVDKLPDQGGLQGLWSIGDAAYFTTAGTTYDFGNGSLRPGTCVQFQYNPNLGTIESITVGNFPECGMAYDSVYNRNRPILTKNY